MHGKHSSFVLSFQGVLTIWPQSSYIMVGQKRLLAHSSCSRYTVINLIKEAVVFHLAVVLLEIPVNDVLVSN